jgi:hypothetical protein
MPDTSLYDRDFHAWTTEQAAELRRLARERANLPLDFDHLAEEIESMGRSDARALARDLARVLEHLAKLERSPAAAPRAGWIASVIEHRSRIEALLDESPSLRARLPDMLPRAWALGNRLAAVALQAEDAVGGDDLPPSGGDCPYTLDQILAPEWLPSRRQR